MVLINITYILLLLVVPLQHLTLSPGSLISNVFDKFVMRNYEIKSMGVNIMSGYLWMKTVNFGVILENMGHKVLYAYIYKIHSKMC